MNVELLAQFIGQYAIAILAGLVIVITLLILLAWHWFNAHYDDLWNMVSKRWQKFIELEKIKQFKAKHRNIAQLLTKRLTPLQYLGIFLPVGLLISLITFNIFSGIAEAVVEDAAITNFDLTLANTLHYNATPLEITIFNTVTQLAGRWATIIIGLVVGIGLFIWQRPLLLISWLAAILGTSALNAGMKAFFQRPRPEFSNPIIVEQNWSFPSGHAMGALVLYGMLAYLIVRGLNRPLTQLIIISVVTLVLLIGFSRMYLGVHYFSDVLAGFLAGTAWLAIVVSGTEVALRRKWWLQNRPSTRLNSYPNPKQQT